MSDDADDALLAYNAPIYADDAASRSTPPPPAAHADASSSFPQKAKRGPPPPLAQIFQHFSRSALTMRSYGLRHRGIRSFVKARHICRYRTPLTI